LLRALAIALLVTACSQDPTAYRAPAGTPILVISIDTLRSDHLPAYGYRGVETPAIDALRADGVLFERAYSHVPLTLPSHSSLLTGVLPAAHGVRDNVGYVLDSRRIDEGSLPFLPATLKRGGYATGGAVSAFVLRGKTGFSTGFDRYDDAIEFRTGVGLGGLQRSGLDTLAAIEPWLAEVAERPFFLFFHLYEPHTPYRPPEPFAAKYGATYDGEVAAADQVVGELVAELRRLGIYERALIFLVSDHGEGLGEHGEDEHGLLLYRETLQVPLLMKLPGGAFAGAASAAPAQLVDVVPTVLSALDLPLPEGLPGSSLLGLLGAAPPARRIYSETFYPRLHFGWSDLASLIDDRHHYIAGPEPELYDLAADSRELSNLAATERRAAAELRGALEAYDRTLTEPGEVDAATRDALAALGYVGSRVTPGAGPLPDPKREIGSLAEFKHGIELESRKQYAEAAAAFRTVLARNPRLVDAWEFLGRALERLGEDDAALEAYRRCLELSGGSPSVALAAASIHLERNELELADQHARLGLAAQPSFAHGLLAQIALARKDLPVAEREARAALAAGEGRIGPLITLAFVLHAQGAFDEALATVGQAERAYGERRTQDLDLVQGLQLVRGKSLADLGRVAEAEAAFEREIGGFPEDPRAYSLLAVLYALTGRGERVGPTLKRLVDARPHPESYAEAVKTLRVVEDRRSAAALLAYARRRFPDSRALAGL
jgi:arylsulfatase A-like enzyme/cytochrome c-type biogenesis protein CcmH/NrfG